MVLGSVHSSHSSKPLKEENERCKQENGLKKQNVEEKQSATGIPQNCVVKKPHSIAEELVLPTALAMVPVITDEKWKHVPLEILTVSGRSRGPAKNC